MSNKILVNGAIATKLWIAVIEKVLIAFLVFPLAPPLLILTLVIWFISLGHIDFLSILTRFLRDSFDKVFPI